LRVMVRAWEWMVMMKLRLRVIKICPIFVEFSTATLERRK
jgi:hypothetical protein